ncbi:MAG: PaaI family thioesterase [Gemmatimonadaceae bacterium]
MARGAVQDPNYEFRVRESFARQTFMATIGASLVRVGAGEVRIALPFNERLTQQHDFLHAGVVASVLDSACGYAALTLMEPGAGVMSVEFKVNLMAPAAGNRFVAVGRVVRAGRTLTVCQGELRAVQDEGEVVVALMQGTMMAIRDRAGIAD